MEDTFLIKQVLSGNTGAFKFLVIRYERPIFQFLTTFTLPRPVIEELAQETFLRAYKSLSDYDPTKGASFSSWIFTIAKNLAINEMSRASSRSEIKVPDADVAADIAMDTPSQEQILADSQVSTQLKEAVQRLPLEFRTAVSLSYLDEMSMEEIAAVEKCSVGTVKSRIFRGKALLRKALFSGMEKKTI
jgi:RNA polymerase sigma-70 factor (ECF subfamily)